VAGDKAGPFKLTKSVRVVIAMACGALAVAHFQSPTLPIDAVFLGLLGAGVAFLYYNVLKIGPGGVEAQLAEAEREVEGAPVTQEVAVPPPAPVDERLDAAIAAPAAPQLPSSLRPAVPPSPAVEALLTAIEAVRIEAIVVLGNAGRLVPAGLDWIDYDPVGLLHALVNAGLASSTLVAPLGTVLMVREDVLVRGLMQVEVIHRATALANEICEKLRAIKRNYHRVIEDSLGLYEDQAMTAQLKQPVHGLMLAELDDDGTVLHRQVFPSETSITRGFFVSWEWDLKRVIRQPAWYRDPKGTANHAWSAAATFIGRAYPYAWHLEQRFANPNVGLE